MLVPPCVGSIARWVWAIVPRAAVTVIGAGVVARRSVRRGIPVIARVPRGERGFLAVPAAWIGAGGVTGGRHKSDSLAPRASAGQGRGVILPLPRSLGDESHLEHRRPVLAGDQEA